MRVIPENGMTLKYFFQLYIFYMKKKNDILYYRKQNIEVYFQMNKIIVYRTHIEINDYELGDSTYIEKKFSIYDMTYHKLFPKGMIYDKDRRVLMLPRGIDIGWLEKHFGCEAVISGYIDPIGDVSPIMLKYKPRDDVQKEAIKFMLSMDKYSSNERNTMLSINLNTGKGKTYCAIATAAYLGMRSIVITDSVGWLEQWKDFFMEYTDIKSEEIYMISGSPSFMKLFNRDISKYKVILSTHSTLKSIGDSKGWDKIREFFKYCQIGIKFFDEAHLNFDNMFQIDCNSETFITYYLTATPGRSDWAENEIFKNYFKNVPSIDLFDGDNDPHTKYIGFRFTSNPSPVEVQRCKNNYGLNRIAYIDYLVRNEEFKKVLIILINLAIKKPGKHLFYIGTNDAILYVRDLIYQYFPELIGQVGIYTSIVPDDKKRAELDKKIILSTTKSAGAAVDIPGLIETVNLAEPFKSRVIAQQTFGRTRADGTMYKDVVDTGFFYTKKFYEFKKPVFKKYATECVEVHAGIKDLDERANKILVDRSNMVCPIEFDPSYDPV